MIGSLNRVSYCFMIIACIDTLVPIPATFINRTAKDFALSTTSAQFEIEQGFAGLSLGQTMIHQEAPYNPLINA